MAAGRKPERSGGSGEAAERVDPHAPTKATLRPKERREPARHSSDTGDFSPDAPTRIMPPTPSLERPPPPPAAYPPEAATQALNLGGLPEADDPFATRVTEVEMPSFSSQDAARLGLSDESDRARVDLRAPARDEMSGSFDVFAGEAEVVEISLSDMDPLSDEEEGLAALSEADDDEDTSDTIVNLPRLADLRPVAPAPLAAPAPPSMPSTPPAAAPPSAPATVVERRSYDPTALFDDDPASVTDPARDQPPPRGPFHVLPGFDGDSSSGTGTAIVDAAEGEPDPGDAAQEQLAVPAPIPVAELPVVDVKPRGTSADQTSSRPSLASQPSGAPATATLDAGSASTAEPVPPSSDNEGEAPWPDDVHSVIDHERDSDDETVAPTPAELSQLSEPSEDESPPLLHKWKVVPTAIRELDGAPPPPKPAGFASIGQAKALQTVLWSPEDEAAARAQRSDDQRARNPFWAPTDTALEADDPLESTEAAAPSDPRMAAAAYIHDAIAYLRSLSHFAAHLDEEVRREFEGRVVGANDRLRRALAELADAYNNDDAHDDEG